MTTKPWRCATRAPNTVPITGTVRATTVQLDHTADVALHYAQAWLYRAGTLKVPTSGVIRRALQFYAAHLGISNEGEVRQAHRACTASPVDEEARRGTWKRLQGISSTEPLPPYLEILRGPCAASEAEALAARAEALAAEVLTRKAPTRRPGTAPTP